MKFPETLKRVTKRLLVRSEVPSALGRLAPTSAVVLIYHSVHPEPDAFAHTIGAGIIHPASAFAAQMALLARHFSPVTLDEVLEFVAGRGTLPRRAVAVTFDDGFRDNGEVAAPILARYGIRATFYVTAGSLETNVPPWFCRLRHAFHAAPDEPWTDPDGGGRWDLADDAARSEAMIAVMRRCAAKAGARQQAWVASIERSLGVPLSPQMDQLMLRPGQVVALRTAGHAIGSHTMTHPNLAHVSADDVRRELEDSKRVLEACLGEPVRHFSYPNPALTPHWSPQTRAMTEELGYRTAVTCDCSRARPGCDPLLIPRLAAPMDLNEFHWALEATFLGHQV